MELSPRSPPEMLESDCPSPLELKSAPSKKMWIKLRSLLRYMVKQLENGEVNIEELKKNLEYTASLLEAVYIDETRQILDTEDELRELRSDAVPSEVRDWLASTFTQQTRAKGRRAEEKPKFRSIVHAVQAGIFVERMFRRTYTSVGPTYSTAVHNCLKNLDLWCFDVFSLNRAADDHALQQLERIDKSKALSLLLHAADISHPTKQWSVHSRWTKALMEEFFRQGDKEAELGLPFSPLCDRTSTLVAQSQIGFIDFIVEPTFSVLTDVAEKSVQPLADDDSKPKSQPSFQWRQPSLDVDVGDPNPDVVSFRATWTKYIQENKQKWKERAASGITNQMSIDELSPCEEEAPSSPAGFLQFGGEGQRCQPPGPSPSFLPPSF